MALGWPRSVGTPSGQKRTLGPLVVHTSLHLLRAGDVSSAMSCRPCTRTRRLSDGDGKCCQGAPREWQPTAGTPSLRTPSGRRFAMTDCTTASGLSWCRPAVDPQLPMARSKRWWLSRRWRLFADEPSRWWFRRRLCSVPGPLTCGRPAFGFAYCSRTLR
jgi:hypothetical protein